MLIFAFPLWMWLGWSCIFQITAVMKSSLNPSVKGTDGCKLGRSSPVSSVMVLQISRQLRKTSGFCWFLLFPIYFWVFAGGGERAHCSRQGEDLFFHNFLQGRVPVACSTCQVSFRRKHWTILCVMRKEVILKGRIYTSSVLFLTPPPMIVAMVTVGQSLSTPIKELHLTGAVQGLCH